ncbi:DNA repair protein RAD51 homolog 4-like [Coccinella septempunctata]|uniref:DNA repair protein RAD51 homolog 4-like n=1 Tax=Coccinella septempunctata TaxID=41139 RepID=UPI001D086B0D|nr:DNA repair protein RAD51 homolog 4-like [Coccinella septempunctata]
MERLKKDVHPSLNDSAILALNRNGIFTARDFISFDSQKLAKISLLLFKEILEIKKILLKKHAAISENGYDCYQDLLKNSALIPSGIQSVDEFLEGGLLTSNIYEIYGRASSGKSLLAYIFMKNLVLKMKQKCFFLDSKNDFSAEKFYSLCGDYLHEEVMNGLSRIFIKSIKNKFDLLNSLQEISEYLEKNSTISRLIVIDSLVGVISNHNDHSLNNLFLTHLANIMHFIATKYHVVILVINLMTTWVEGDFAVQIREKEIVSCGRYWYTIPNTRIKLERELQNLKLSIEKSNTFPSKTCLVDFSEIVDHVK